MQGRSKKESDRMPKKKAGAAASDSKPSNLKKQGKDVDLVRVYAEKIRDHKELESRWAILSETRIEYFRGKDFISFFKNHSELKEILGTEYLSLEAEDIGNLLLRRNLVVRCDRVVKTVRPGKKKLSTWPAHLELHPEQLFSEGDSFFAWTFEKRRPLWQTILSFLVPVVTLACCLFPIFPHWCKLVVLYSCLGFLSLIFTTLFLRWVIFGILWVLLGKRIWFFPNILAEEATFSELFRFWPQPSKDEEEPPKWTARLAFACIIFLVMWVSIRHAPDEAARARYQKQVYNIIDDVLEWSPRLALSGNKMQEKPAGPNIVQEKDTAVDDHTSETNKGPDTTQENEVSEDLESHNQEVDLEDFVSDNTFSKSNMEEEMMETK
uniref:Translocation protein SEC62 n=1 Tax=Araucaria cunninghamii TaxID=56994 RepID=A0A0D6R3Z8_ARACU